MAFCDILFYFVNNCLLRGVFDDTSNVVVVLSTIRILELALN